MAFNSVFQIQNMTVQEFILAGIVSFNSVFQIRYEEFPKTWVPMLIAFNSVFQIQNMTVQEFILAGIVSFNSVFQIPLRDSGMISGLP